MNRKEKLLRSKTLLVEAKDVDVVTDESISPDVKAEIERFYAINEEIAVLKQKMEDAKKIQSVAKREILDYLHSLTGVEKKAIKIENYLLELTKRGYDRRSFQYKEAFETALTKVNAQTRRILNEALAATEKLSTIEAAIRVTKTNDLDEGNIVSTVKKRLADIFLKLTTRMNGLLTGMSNLETMLKKIV